VQTVNLSILATAFSGAAFYPRHDRCSTFAKMVAERTRRDAVPTSLDPFDFQHRMYFPSPFRPTDAAHNHSALDFARLTVRAVENHETSHADFYRRFQNTLVSTAAVRPDDVENLLSCVAILRAGRHLDYYVLRLPLLRVADFYVKIIVLAVACMDVALELRAQQESFERHLNRLDTLNDVGCDLF